ncbi:MAG TPA: hypothetical protein VF796_16795, partial [Humisphaera sp.]
MRSETARAVPLIGLLVVGAVNVVAAVLCAALWLVGPEASASSARLRFTELDRAGVVNAPALRQFDASHAFGDVDRLEYRRTVPDYIAGPAADGQRTA